MVVVGGPSPDHPFLGAHGLCLYKWSKVPLWFTLRIHKYPLITILGQGMKTIASSGNIAVASAVLVAALLLATPVMFARAASFSYMNKGESAWLTATNNDDNTNFTITAMNYTYIWQYGNINNTMIGNMSVVGLEFNVTRLMLMSSEHFTFGNTTRLGNVTGFFLWNSQLNNTQALTNNMSAIGPSNATISDLLASMHSSYALIGTGDHDTFNLTGGITADTWSITAPGFNNTVNINTGEGSCTWNINLGAEGNVAINTINSTTIAETTNIYNIIF